MTPRKNHITQERLKELGSSDVKKCGAVTITRNGYVEELEEENRHLKDMLANLSKTHAKDRQRLSDMIDEREKVLGHIAAIMQEKDDNGEHILIYSDAWKSIRRWSVYFQKK